MATRKAHSNMLRWGLIGILVVVVALADWHAGGIVPRLFFGTATLNLTSAPDGARVFLDGEVVGETPLHAKRVLPGEMVLRMEHRFHDAVARRVQSSRGEVIDVHIEFPPSTGSLEIVTNPRGAEITVGGARIDAVTPVLLAPHPTGSFDVTTWIHGRERKTETVDVLPRQNTEVSFDLERVPLAEIYLTPTPRDAELEIGGEPYKPGMTLAVGTHDLRARREGYAPVDRTIDFTRGRNDHAISLVRQRGSLSLAVSPDHAKVRVSYPDADGWRPYEEDMVIPTGRVTVRATAAGYRAYERRLTIGLSTLKHAIRLEAYDVQPGRQFRDKLASGGTGPLLVVIGTGSFRMGSVDGSPDERPVRTVVVAKPFAIGVFETTREEYREYRAAKGWAEAVSEPLHPEDPPMSEALLRLPMSRLSWENGQDYVSWLSEETGYRYRLPTEAEWEYVARAGSTGDYYFGTDPAVFCAHGNVADRSYAIRFRKPETADCTDGGTRWVGVGSFPPNAFGVHDMLGNVEEWVADCWRDDYRNAPNDQRARSGHCQTHVLRGGAWDSSPHEATVSYRSFSNRGSGTRGVRVVRDL
ncbi:MAG: SUMF1/EgtB/PvdO family nonheme iron enzyme [Gammaproteobacteria bacterium]|nr:SUMF1/EgtB/PvdO family nonheme iron enzyme [Gammaproteobacteria bacterium]